MRQQSERRAEVVRTAAGVKSWVHLSSHCSGGYILIQHLCLCYVLQKPELFSLQYKATVCAVVAKFGTAHSGCGW